MLIRRRRAVRIHSGRVYRDGYPQHHDKLVWFRLFHGGSARDSRGASQRELRDRFADVCRTTVVTLSTDEAKVSTTLSTSW